MTKKLLYNSGFPVISIIFYLVPFFLVPFFIFKGMGVPSALFYGAILLVVSFVLNKNNQWIRLYSDRLLIVGMKPWFNKIEIRIDMIESVSSEEGIELTNVGGEFIAGVPDRIYVNYRKGAKTQSVLLRTHGLDNDNPLYEYLFKNCKA